MAYFLNLFTPETWEAFSRHGSGVSGFRARQSKLARERVKQGDIFLCYLVRVSRWCGALEITSGLFEDDTPIFGNPDPFIIRFKVNPICEFKPENSIPIFEDDIWDQLSETKGIEKGARGWAVNYRRSLREINSSDGQFLLSRLKKQAEQMHEYQFSDRDLSHLNRQSTVRSVDRVVHITLPEEEDEEQLQAETEGSTDVRESIQMQACIADIGRIMGFSIWIPKADRSRVYSVADPESQNATLDELLSPVRTNGTD